MARCIDYRDAVRTMMACAGDLETEDKGQTLCFEGLNAQHILKIRMKRKIEWDLDSRAP